jgi:predicted AlkP superfamily pyrophosphatase or phosphodiesterase
VQSYGGSITGGTVQGASEPRAGPPVRRFWRDLATWWLAAALLPLAPDAAAQTAPRPRPRLVVVIAVDQLRADYIERFRPYFGAGGFNLFLQRGASFAQARYAHATTSTCPGHAVILTGSYGEVNGIIANEWYDTRTGRPTYCAEDTAVTLVGSAGPGGSPRKLFGATVGDVLRTATAGRSRVVTVSAKNRSAIMLGGQLADAAYWMVDTLFVTSTYYRADLPGWAREFNASGAMSRYFGQTWDRLLPAAAYQMMGPDDEPAERDVAGMGRTFPHRIAGIDALHGSPFLNDVMADFAMRAVDAEGLGRDTVSDLLGLSFSANDGVGHTFGPESHEVMDATVRLDRTLQRLFGFLDRTIGLANVVVVLTADHGVAPMPEVLARIRPGSTARRLDPAIIESAVRKALSARYGQVDAPGWVVYHVPPQMYLNRAALAALNIPVEDAERVAQSAVRSVPGVHEVLTGSELTRQRAAGIESGPVHSFHPSRSGNLYYMLEPYWLPDPSASGAEHGSGWRYDQEVPLLWFGRGILPGVHQGPAYVADIAPTLSALLGLLSPGGSQGRVLSEMLR